MEALTSVRRKYDGERATREERAEIIAAARAGFPGKGRNRVDWRAAFAARPGWKTKLGAETPAGMARLYVFAEYLWRKESPRSKNPVALVRRNGGHPPAPPVEFSAPVAVPAGVSFCPGCGCSLEMYHQVAASVMQMQQAETMQQMQTVITQLLPSMPPQVRQTMETFLVAMQQVSSPRTSSVSLR